MELVVDANVLLASFLKEDPRTLPLLFFVKYPSKGLLSRIFLLLIFFSGEVQMDQKIGMMIKREEPFFGGKGPIQSNKVIMILLKELGMHMKNIP